MKKVYIIISTYNEEGNVGILAQSLEENLKAIQNCSYELVFVNDGSKDQTLVKLLDLQKIYQNITIINQSKNFGHELAMTAGMNYAA